MVALCSSDRHPNYGGFSCSVWSQPTKKFAFFHQKKLPTTAILSYTSPTLDNATATLFIYTLYLYQENLKTANQDKVIIN